MKLKQITIFTFLFFLGTFAKAQYVNIPDSNFRVFLMSKYPSAFNGNLQMDTTNSLIRNETVLMIFGASPNIRNLNGLQYFKNLIQLSVYNLDSLKAFPNVTNTITDLALYYLPNLHTLNRLPSNVVGFSFDGTNLDSLPILPASLKLLSNVHEVAHAGNYAPMTVLPNNRITKLPILPSNLDWLELNVPNLAILPILPNSITTLRLVSTKISNINTLPTSLASLILYKMPLKCLPELPNSLTGLLLDTATSLIKCLYNKPNNLIISNGYNFNPLNLPVCNSTNNPNNCPLLQPASSLIQIQDSVFGEFLYSQFPTYGISLDSNNKYWMDTLNINILNEDTLTIQSSIPIPNKEIRNADEIKYFKNLVYLYFEGSAISNIAGFPPKLKYLFFAGHDVTTLPKLPQNLETLWCNQNLLTKLPILPNTLKFLDAGNGCLCSSLFKRNKIDSVFNLPPNLETLVLFENQSLKYIQSFPNKLRTIALGVNELKTMPNLPDSLNEIVSLSDSLFCVSRIPKNVTQFGLLGKNLKCLPNTFSSYDPNIHKPICNSTNNPNNCPTNPLFEGIVYYDNNKNNKLDAGDTRKSFAKISLQTGDYSYTNDSGFYQITIDSNGSNTITVSKPQFYTAIPQSITRNFNGISNTAKDTFALQSNSIIDSVATSITNYFGRTRPGATTDYFAYYENIGTTNLNTTMTIKFDTSKLVFDSFITFNTYNPLTQKPTSFNIISNTISIQQNIIPGQKGLYVPQFTAKTNLQMNDSIITYITLTGGTSTAKDSSIIKVVNSYDPNDKQSTPELTPAQVQAGNYIDYTIRFQNKGNAAALRVLIVDTLSNLLQSNIVQGIASSHNVRTSINNGVVEFEFKNINLPDSMSNPLASHGFVRFRVLPLNTLSAGTIVPNKAGIYFDYNPAIITNTTNTFIRNIVLPVKLTNYAVTSKQNALNQMVVDNVWSTSNELNTSHFNIQRSINTSDFTTIGQIKAKGFGEYLFTDNSQQLNVEGKPLTVFYRLQIIDKDGGISYSAIKQITINPKQQIIKMYPNPAQEMVWIEGKDMIQVNVIDNVGKPVATQNVSSQSRVKIDIQNLNKGVYLLQVKMKNGSIENQKLIVE